MTRIIYCGSSNIGCFHTILGTSTGAEDEISRLTDRYLKCEKNLEQTTATTPLYVCTSGGLENLNKEYVPGSAALVTFTSNTSSRLCQSKAKLIINLIYITDFIKH